MRAAADAGAAFVGVIFAGSKRRVTESEARAIRLALGPRQEIVDTGAAAIAHAVENVVQSAGRPLLVGVFARQSADEINRITAAVDLDLIQLSGGEHPALAARLIRPVLRAIHVRSDATADSVRADIDHAPGVLPLLDAHSEAGGGSGQTFDWAIAAAVARDRACMLAGGLTPENVADAVRRVHPWARRRLFRRREGR